MFFLSDKKVPSIKLRRVGVLENSNTPIMETVPLTLAEATLPTMVLPIDTSQSPIQSESSELLADQDEILETRKDLGQLNGEACVSPVVPEVPSKIGTVENDTNELSLYAAQMQKEFESCLLSLSCDG